MPADRRHRGPDRSGARGLGAQPPDQLGLDAAVGSRQDHRRRPRAAAGARLQRLSAGGGLTWFGSYGSKTPAYRARAYQVLRAIFEPAVSAELIVALSLIHISEPTRLGMIS